MARTEAVATAVAGTGEPAGLWRAAWPRLRHNPAVIVGACLVALFVLAAVFAPWLAPHSPTHVDLSRIRPGFVPGPSAQHPFGLDQLGRDELSRVLYGARSSLLLAMASVGIGASVGVLIGAVAGASGQWVDNVLMRLMDLVLAVPGLLFAIAVAAALGRSLTSVIIAIGVVNVPIFARLLRGSILAERERDYVLAARAVGVKRWRVTIDHVIPNSIGPVVVQGTLALATAVIDAAGLAFLGLSSADPGVPEWGRMLAETQSSLQHAPHLALFPGVAIAATVLGFNLLGDGLRETLDPKLAR